MKINQIRFQSPVRAITAIALFSLVTLLGTVHAVSAASPSELLEKGIYSEETKGDLAAAVQLYRQVVTEAREGEALAAQAQYRLGVCYYKQKDYAQATAAFEKLVDDYPGQKDLVAKAGEYLARAVALEPAPWADGEALRLDIKFATGFKLGTAIYTARAGESNGRKIWQVSSRLFAGVQQVSKVEVEADSFKPLHSRWKHSLLGDADTVYGAGRAEMKVKGKNEIKKVDIAAVCYDNEEVVHWMRRLPLAAGYKTGVPVFTSLGGGSCIPLKLEVTAIENVEVPVGTFECYKVELNVKQTFWYSTDVHRYLVKFEGGGVVAQLTEITVRKAGEPVQYQDAALGFSLTAPADWVFHRPEVKEGKKAAVLMLDPDADATSLLRVESMDKLKPEAQKSARAWAEQIIGERSNEQDLKVRADGWQDRKLNGRPAVSYIGDYQEGSEKMVAYGVCGLGEANATEFCLMVSAKDFESFRPKFDAILDSYKER